MKNTESPQNTTANKIGISADGQMNQSDRINIFNQIQETPGDSLIERMLVFCEENEYDPMELGELFSNDTQFKRVLWLDAVRMNQVNDPGASKLLKETKELDIW